MRSAGCNLARPREVYACVMPICAEFKASGDAVCDKIRQDFSEAASSQPWVFMAFLAAGSRALCGQRFNYLPGYIQHRASSNHQIRHFDNVRVIGLGVFAVFFVSHQLKPPVLLGDAES